MSEYEFLDLISTFRQEAVAHQMAYFAVWSAYMVAVYLIGRELSGTYAALPTLVYTVFVIVPAFGFQVAMKNQYSVIDAYLATFPASALAEPEIVDVPLIILAVDVIG
jgi:hypothetical protein